MAEFAVKSVKSHAIAADGKKVTLTFAGQYFPEIALAMPPELIDGLMAALGEVKVALRPQSATNAGPAIPSAPSAKTEPQQNQVSVRRPKSWMVAADTKINNLVVLIFDFKTAVQSGFALDPKGAKELAAALVKNADAVLEAPGKK